MKLTFDYNNINTKVVKSLLDEIDALNNTRNKCNQLSIPSGFKYYNYLSDLRNEITDIHSSITNTKDDLYRSNQEYERLMVELNNSINHIDNTMIDSQEINVR